MKKLEDLPRPMLVFLVLFVGALFFFITNPPKDICDVQLDVVKKNLTGIIFPNSKKDTTISSLYKRSLDQCELGNTLGACLEFFSTLRQFIKEINAVQYECLTKVTSNREINESIVNGVKVLASLAWGEVPPDLGATNRYGWLEMAEYSVYCNLKNIYVRKNGEELWDTWVAEVIMGLPEAKKMPSEEAFVRSLFSLRCEAIL
jgi:hypothetical protein